MRQAAVWAKAMRAAKSQAATDALWARATAETDEQAVAEIRRARAADAAKARKG